MPTTIIGPWLLAMCITHDSLQSRMWALCIRDRTLNYAIIA
jgi:hypothetical protein